MRILNFGSLNLDHVYQLSRFVQPGETVTAAEYAVHLGGKGHNQSVALAKAGASVWHAGMIGVDGDALRTHLTRWGVHTDCLRTAPKPTGHSVIQVDAEGQNAIIVYPGANGSIDKKFAQETLSHFGSGDYLLLQNEISALPDIMELAHSQGMHIVLNPSPFNPGITACPLQYVRMFVVNELEGAALSGQTEPESICGAIRRLYPGASVLLTLGADGAVYDDGGKITRQPAYPADVVDTTAAGDTFTGYFLAWLLGGAPVEDALNAAGMAAAIAISRPGAAPSIPEKREVVARLEHVRD